MTSGSEYVVSSITWHQWHQTAEIPSSTGRRVSVASLKAALPHSRQRMSPARFGRGEKRNSLTKSIVPADHAARCTLTPARRPRCSAPVPAALVWDLVQLDLVTEGIEDIDATPAGYRIGLLERHAARTKAFGGLGQIVHAQGEVPPRIERQLILRGEVHVSGAGFEPQARAVRERRRTRQFFQTQKLAIETPRGALLSGWVEDLHVV